MTPVDGAPKLTIVKGLDESIAKVMSEIAALDAKAATSTAAADEKRREAGGLLAEKRKTFMTRPTDPYTQRGKYKDRDRQHASPGFIAWCASQGYNQQTVSRLIRFSELVSGHEGQVQTYANFIRGKTTLADDSKRQREQRAAKKAELHDLREQVAAKRLGHKREYDNAYRQEQTRIANQVKEVADKLGKSPKEVLKSLEEEEVEKRKEERRAAQEKARLEREVLEAEKARVSAGLGRYQYPREEATVEIAREIITSGFRQLSLQRHPDVGGTSDGMTALTTARNWLVSVLAHPFIYRTIVDYRTSTKERR